MGHVADLPVKGLAVDVDNGFKPTYELTTRGRDVVKDLRAALKNASELYLATDEDREGEAISWHLLEHLKPRVPVKRMVFHEITRSAIEEAVANPRGIDYGLVDAAETRRVAGPPLRLRGLAGAVAAINRGLSAGRVQSPMIRLVVQRERERMAFVSAGYWDIDATVRDVALVHGDAGRPRRAQGRHAAATSVPTAAPPATWSCSTSPARARWSTACGSRRSRCAASRRRTTGAAPKAPFMTSTLQQEGGRKLRLSAQQVMRLAQDLYERGYITYMRTDSTALSDTAIGAARSQVTSLFGREYLSPSARKWEGKVKNAQEAHEAIRPAGDTFRTPAEVRRELNNLEHRLYELIWMRTLASQMADAARQDRQRPRRRARQRRP